MLQSRISRMLYAVPQHWIGDTGRHVLQSRASRMLSALPNIGLETMEVTCCSLGPLECYPLYPTLDWRQWEPHAATWMLPAGPLHWTGDSGSYMLQSRASRMLSAVPQHWIGDTGSHMLHSRASRMLSALPQHWTGDSGSHMLPHECYPLDPYIGLEKLGYTCYILLLIR
jgi:hypothetical protein